MTETASIRTGEEIDTAGLWRYLRDRIESADGEIDVEQFPAGSSNLTYLVRVGTAEYVLRRPPFGNTVKSAHDMRREFETLSKLSTVYEPAPKPLLFCDDQSIIGSEFYLMERRHGLIIRGQIPGRDASVNERAGRLAGLEGSGNETTRITVTDLTLSQPAREQVCQSFIRNLADLHSLDYRSAGLENLGHPEGYNRRQVEGWTKRYFAAKTHERDALENAIRWLHENIPAESGTSLIHNDYKFDNVMLDPEDLGRITAVLDWEMVTIGDPLMDVGTTLGYWMSPDAGGELLSMPFNPRVLMENVSRKQLVEMYEQAVGREVPDMLFYYVFGTFKIAVIAQQIYARYVKGFTKDKRFAHFDRFVEKLGDIAATALERRSI
ncbi:MAG TPA: phosphotransferase family protein [Pyrinomonadaceae bacterium]|nr:phosphotransferase family protein [Pyrinomonadaceae bacterium]